MWVYGHHFRLQILGKSVMETADLSVEWNPLLCHPFHFICGKLHVEERSSHKTLCYTGFISPEPGQCSSAYCLLSLSEALQFLNLPENFVMTTMYHHTYI